MVKKAATPKEEPSLTVEFDGLPVTESEAATLPVAESKTTSPVNESETITPVTETESTTPPVTEANVNATSEKDDKDPQDVTLLSLKIAELEDKLVKLELELSSHLDKKKNKKERKGKKVKCKCKDKTVDVSKCKCETKKLDK